MAQFEIPKEVSRTTKTLQAAEFEAYLVGGCVRDLVRDMRPKDWDVTTSAAPEEIQKLFEHSFYENDYGTVGVVNEDASDEALKTIEVTPYRIEGKYKDGRRPSEVHFSDKLEDDLKRRDFTVNAMCYDPEADKLIDLYGGHDDINAKIIRTVGEPETRFGEDYLRILRAVRLATELEFEIEGKTAAAVAKHAEKIKGVAIERVRDEFSRILLAGNPKKGIELLHTLGLLQYIVPELEEGIGVEQNGDHIYSVWEHNLRALQHAADREWPLHIRLGALLHDVSKPETRRWSKDKNDWTFYGHDVVGARTAKKILERLKYSREIVQTVRTLVRWHLFFTDIDRITLSAVRRLVRNVGPENVDDLMKIRACDRIGMGRPKETPYRLRKYKAMIEEAQRAPVSVRKLAITGDDLMNTLGESPGPRIGWVLHALLEDVLDDPKQNTKKYLEARARELAKLPDSELAELGKKGRAKQEEEEGKELKEIRKKYHVK